MLYLDGEFIASLKNGGYGDISINAAENEVSVWGVSLSSTTACTSTSTRTTSTCARVTMTSRSPCGSASLEMALSTALHNDREIQVKMWSGVAYRSNGHTQAHGRQASGQAVGQFQTGDILLMDPTSQCPAHVQGQHWRAPLGPSLRPAVPSYPCPRRIRTSSYLIDPSSRPEFQLRHSGGAPVPLLRQRPLPRSPTCEWTIPQRPSAAQTLGDGNLRLLRPPRVRLRLQRSTVLGR